MYVLMAGQVEMMYSVKRAFKRFYCDFLYIYRVDQKLHV